MKLIPVRYHKKEYPHHIIPLLDEVAGHFDCRQPVMNSPFSLHTEYSFTKRSMNSELLVDLEELKLSTRNGIPQLWKSETWSIEFAIFIKRLLAQCKAPYVVEIHPPFMDYCRDLETFWDRYLVFYDFLKDEYPDVKIVIENRCGTMYPRSTFLFSNCRDILNLADFIENGNRELGIVVDYPQLMSAEKIRLDNIALDGIREFNRQLKSVVSAVAGIHLWGKRKSAKSNRWLAHNGDLNTLFSGDATLKQMFLMSMMETFEDEKARFFVPEVNSAIADLDSIVNDVISVGAVFVETLHG